LVTFQLNLLPFRVERVETSSQGVLVFTSKHNQMVRFDTNPNLIAHLVIVVTGKGGLDDAASGQLQGIKSGGAGKDLGDNLSFSGTAVIVNNIVRTQQNVYGSVVQPLVTAVALDFS